MGDGVASVAIAGHVDPFVFGFDENGTGRISTDGGKTFKDLNGKLMADPVLKGKAMSLTFILPEKVFTGDLLILEPTGPTTDSDIIRFTNAKGDLDGKANGDRLIFYSNAPEDGSPAKQLGDTGVPSTSTDIIHRELGKTDDNNGDIYFARQGAPGGPDVARALNQYAIVSDGSIPEPSSLVLICLGAGAVLLILLLRQRRSRRAAARA
jgi:hypothetical protein